MRKSILSVALALSLCSCALHDPVPKGYSGPLVLLSDSCSIVDSRTSKLFIVAEIDDKPVENAVTVSKKASDGKGAYLQFRCHSRLITLKPLKLKIVATHFTPSFIREAGERAVGHFLSTEGVVEFVPREGTSYFVRGKLDPKGSSVWVEDARTGEAVTKKVRSL